jgi:hypothetical protein
MEKGKKVDFYKLIWNNFQDILLMKKVNMSCSMLPFVYAIKRHRKRLMDVFISCKEKLVNDEPATNETGYLWEVTGM